MQINDKMEIFRAQSLISAQHNKELASNKNALTEIVIQSITDPKQKLCFKNSCDEQVLVCADYNHMPVAIFLELAELLKAAL